MLLFLSLVFHASASWATLEPDLVEDGKTEADFCPSCAAAAQALVHPPGQLEHLPSKATPDCGQRCEALLAAAKAEGMRCPHEWANFKKRGRGNDACEFYRSKGKDPTQWSKGLCATAVHTDFVKVGIPVAPADAHSWAQMLKDPKLNMKKLDINDPAQAPRGAVLVYSSYNGHGYGHVEVAMGDEFCSDYCYPVNFLVKAPGEKGKLLGAYMPLDG